MSNVSFKAIYPRVGVGKKVSEKSINKTSQRKPMEVNSTKPIKDDYSSSYQAQKDKR